MSAERADQSVCVLIPVHRLTPAAQLQESLASMQAQEVPPTEILVVRDGPLDGEHDEVLALAASGPSPLVQLPLLPARGIAGALQAGVDHTKCKWIARMDGDDIADPRRLAIQLETAASGEYDVIGSAMLEFEHDASRPVAVRAMPTRHDEILRELRRTNPLNHPTVLLRRSAVLAAGGYRRLQGLEDYDLWARMAARGARFVNLPEPLVRYRVDTDLFHRRQGLLLARAEIEMQRNLLSYGLVGRPRAVLNALTRVGYRLLPPPLMKIAYALLRRRTNKSA